jgi:tetratricopeptide (TPR) repeat protein
MMRYRAWIVALAVCSAPLFPAFSQTPDRETKFRLAQGFEQSGDFDRAATLYRDLLQGDPRNYVLFDALQRTWMQLKKYDDVVLLVRDRLSDTPRDPNLHALLGTVYYRSGREKEATAQWDSAIGVDSRNPVTYRLVASVLIENRLLDRAVDIYRRGREAANDPALFALELAQTLSAGMDYAGAAREYLLWLRQNPTQLAFVQGRLASWTGKEDARAAALAVVRDAVKHGEDLPLVELEGWLAMEGKDYEAGFSSARRADVLARASGTRILQFADRAFHDGIFEIAARAYAEAIDVPLPAQRRPYAEYGYACALKEGGAQADSLRAPAGTDRATEARPLYGGAIARFRAIIDAYPRTEFSAKSLYQIGLLQAERFDDADGALASFRRVLEEAAGFPPLRYAVRLAIGRIQIRRGDTAAASGEFTAVAGAPDALPDQSDEATFHLAEIDYFGGNFPRAVARLDGITSNLKADYANDAIHLQAFLQENEKTAPEALRAYARGEFTARRGRNTEAVPIFEKIIQEYPRAPLVDDALMTIASLQEAAGFPATAIATYERLLAQFRDVCAAPDRAQYGIAEAYRTELRDRDRAIAAYEKLLADYPASVLSAQARKWIRQLRGDAL